MITRSLRATAALLGAFLWTVPGLADTLHVTDDTYIKLDLPDENNGTVKELRVFGDGSEEKDRTYINFDLSVLPGGANIDKATLRLWVNKVESEGTITFHQVLGGWKEDTLTTATDPVSVPILTTTMLPLRTSKTI